MMKKFQKDDVVKCIDASNTPNLVEGTTYRVNYCNEYYVDISIDCHYDYVNGKFPPTKFSPERFEISSGKPTYVWPMYTAYEIADEAYNSGDIEESSYEELKLRLEQAEELLDRASRVLLKMQNYYKSAMGEELQAEIDLFLE